MLSPAIIFHKHNFTLAGFSFAFVITILFYGTAIIVHSHFILFTEAHYRYLKVSKQSPGILINEDV